MRRKHCPHRLNAQIVPQHGAVLIVSLLILLVMTVIGVTAMQVTVLEERMAGNMRDKDIAFQAAESALRNAEAIMSKAVIPAFNNSSGHYAWDLPTGVSLDIDENSWWNTAANRATYDTSTLAGVKTQPLYIIQQLSPGMSKGGGGSLEGGTAGGIGLFRITARGVGGSSNAVAMVQSIFRR